MTTMALDYSLASPNEFFTGLQHLFPTMMGYQAISDMGQKALLLNSAQGKASPLVDCQLSGQLMNHTFKQLVDVLITRFGGRVMSFYGSVEVQPWWNSTIFFGTGTKGMVAICSWTDKNELNVSLQSNNHALHKEVVAFLKQNLENAPAGRISVIVATSKGPELEKIGLASVPFTPDNYSADVVKDFNHIIEDLKRPDPCGRINILDGVPGTGKTYLVRALSGLAPDAEFVLLNPSLVPQLTGPGMVTLFLRNKEDRRPMVLIVEDADECLVPRGADNMSSISSILNMTDGILGSLLDLRVVATTNAGHLTKQNDAVDEAIMRPGRLCRRIHVGKIPYEQANRRFQQLVNTSDAPFVSPVTLAEIYRVAKDDQYRPLEKKAALGFNQSTPDASKPSSTPPNE